MGRLFWKFFLFIWLAQLAGMFGVGAIFWLEHRQPNGNSPMVAPLRLPGDPGVPRMPANMAEFERGPGQPPGMPPPFPYPPSEQRLPLPGPGMHIPFIPFMGALFASLACAVALAWYFAKPIRSLRTAFDAAAGGNLDVRVGNAMDGRRDELADLGRDFDNMTQRLRSLMMVQKQLLHDVSHEMRSPLARLQAAIGLARQQPSRMENSLERIERESERMNRLVGELLTLSRLDGGVSGTQENVEMGELLGDIVEDARFEGAARQVMVDFTAGPLPEIRANAELLHRAIENVIRNAVRHSPEGATVFIKAVPEKAGMRLTIEDQGSGVPESDLENIFKPFFRGSGQVAGEGYGLGLAIAWRVINSLHGRITARNKAAGGLVVEILLEGVEGLQNLT